MAPQRRRLEDERRSGLRGRIGVEDPHERGTEDRAGEDGCGMMLLAEHRTRRDRGRYHRDEPPVDERQRLAALVEPEPGGDRATQAQPGPRQRPTTGPGRTG